MFKSAITDSYNINFCPSYNEKDTTIIDDSYNFFTSFPNCSTPVRNQGNYLHHLYI